MPYVIAVVLLFVIPLLVIIFLVCFFWKIGSGIRFELGNIFGGFRLVAGVGEILGNQENQHPRQLQNLTNTYTELIKRDFPEFDAKEFLTAAENTLLDVLNSLESGTVLNKSKLSPNLINKLEETIRDIKSKGEEWFFNDIQIHKSCIAKYSSLAGSKVITVEIALEYIHGISKDGVTVSGSNHVQQYKYSIDALYVQDPNQMGKGSFYGHNCPNCGAPVKQVGEDKFCAYCGTGLIEVNTRIWTFDNYRSC